MHAPGGDGAGLLVPAALRGYRLFVAREGRLWPTVHTGSGPWSVTRERAVCAARKGHAAPGPDCGCGLYGWYHPRDARASSGFVLAVIRATGGVVLGEHGFRAQDAEVEAVVVPHLGSDGRTAAALAQAYPQARVYRSRRRMLQDHPPDDLHALGIAGRPSPASRYRTWGLLVWLVGLAAMYSVVVLPRELLADPPAGAWVPAVIVFLAWQTALVRFASLSGGDGAHVVAGGTTATGPATRRTGTPT